MNPDTWAALAGASAYVQPGLYIAENNESRYLGRDLRRFGANSETAW